MTEDRAPAGRRLRAAHQGRRSLAVRWRRLRTRAWQIVQCGAAAGIAWWVATELLGHPRPFFAPVAAVVALGVSYSARLRRVGEVVVGVAVGVAVGDVFVRLVGSGAWQITVVVIVAMALAILLDAGQVLVTQAGVQAVIVTTLVPGAAGVGRWLDAVAGGAVAIAIAAVVPVSPLQRPREMAADLLDDLADQLLAGATSAREQDLARATEALTAARATQSSLHRLERAAGEGKDVAAISPFWRRDRRGLQDVLQVFVPLDRSARNVRVLLRRVVSATAQGEPVPEPLIDLVQQLSDACALLAAELAAEGPMDEAIAALDDVARASLRVPRSSLSADVILAQTRSAVVDLLQVAGLTGAEALARVPPWTQR